MDRFGDTHDYFGSRTTSKGNYETTTTERHSLEQDLSLIKYAMIDVFTCAENIIREYKRSIIDYCVYHRENDGNINTYERYIHIVACHCLIDANFLSPSYIYPAVSFVNVECEFEQSYFRKIKMISKDNKSKNDYDYESDDETSDKTSDKTSDESEEMPIN